MHGRCSVHGQHMASGLNGGSQAVNIMQGMHIMLRAETPQLGCLDV
jgi:hypothetical protein